MIMARILGWRSAAMNMCSVRHSPIPSAPNWWAFCASSGVSAFALTPSRRISSAQLSTVLNSSDTSGSWSGTSSTVTNAPPSSAIQSPSFKTTPFTCICRASMLMSSADAPATHGLPIPRATSAAWLALPPSEVRMPRAARKPATSSASVKADEHDVAAFLLSRDGVRGIEDDLPLAAPADAATPRARIS